MFYRLRTGLHKAWFGLRARAIYQTAPVRVHPGARLTILSQLYHPDVTMYVVAAKSLCQYLQPSRFVIVDDGLTPDDRRQLQHHFENLQFVDASQVHQPGCPRGGTWERLLTIADLNADDYVVQLDSDTVTVDRPLEVLDCVRRNISFTLGTEGASEIVSTAQASATADTWAGSYVTVLAEQALQRLQPALGQRYVHGCSGFTGFRVGEINRDRVEAFSRAMAAALGDAKWAEWGSEQVSSNFLIANSPDAVVLSPEHYPFFQPGQDIQRARLIHFVGTHRFRAGAYVRAAARTVESLHMARAATSQAA